MDECEKNIIRTLEQVVAERPDYVYRPADVAGHCMYVHKDPLTGERTPGCVMGHVMHRMGVPFEKIMGLEGTAAAGALTQVFGTLSWETRFLVNEVQGRQDKSTPWGQALAEAKEFTAWEGIQRAMEEEG